MNLSHELDKRIGPGRVKRLAELKAAIESEDYDEMARLEACIDAILVDVESDQ